MLVCVFLPIKNALGGRGGTHEPRLSCDLSVDDLSAIRVL